MSAAMWRVVHLRNVKHYGKVEEFVSMVAEAIPDILTDRQRRLLSLGLRTKMLLQILNSKESQDLRGVRKLLDSLLQPSSRQVDAGSKDLEDNIARLVQRLLEDSKGREDFFKILCPVEYVPDFDTALETLLCEFLTKLEERVVVPDFKQTAEWISDTPSVLDDYMQSDTKADDLKVLLKSKLCCGQTTKMDTSVPSASEQQLSSLLSFPALLKDTCAKHLDSNAQTLDSQAESEAPAPQEAQDFDLQDTQKESQKESDILNNDEEQTCSDSILDVSIVEEYKDQNTAVSHSPSASGTSPVMPSSMIAPPGTRVAHRCPHCAKCFIYRFELLEHQRLHTGENPYKCSQCGKGFRTGSYLSTHRRTQCKKADYVCIKCGKSFQSVRDKCKHPCIHKRDCSQCGKSFKRRCQLVKHELSHKHIGAVTCKRCREMFPSISALKLHQKTHPPEQSNQCKQCGQFFSSAATLSAHEHRHTQGKTDICALCGKSFKSKNELSIHMRTHTGERPFQCKYCGKQFSMSGNLNVHLRIHTGEKPYMCSDCDKAFISAGELQIHRRTHTGEKPYKCPVCGKGFIKASKVTVHKRVHTGERPYVCPECGKAFSRGCGLKKHRMQHTGVRPYICHQCGKTYTCLNHLKTHLKTHNKIQTQTA